MTESSLVGVPQEVDVSPDMQFYNLLESYPYNTKGALCEYIDNALDAFIEAKKNNQSNIPDKLKLQITLGGESIIVRDYGVGISTNEIQRAMKPGYRKQQQSLSEFGIGMKAASMWLGRKWDLDSYPIGGQSDFKLSFDLDELLAKGEDKVSLKILEKPSNPGVQITISKLRHNIDENYAERVWEELQETYQLFTSRENPVLDLSMKYKSKTLPKKNFQKLKVTNTPLYFPKSKFHNAVLYAIGKPVTWKKDIKFKFEGKTVHGFISLGAEMTQRNPCVRLFRYGRLIRGSELEPYKPVDLVGTANKAAPSRFYAELHLDGQKISNSKGEFVFDEYLFIEALSNQEGVEEFIEQAENYRQRRVDKEDYVQVDSITDFEKATGSKVIKTKKKNTKKKKKAFKEKLSAISTLEKQTAHESFLLLDTFIEEAIRLYNEGRMWPFCLVYRTILEVSIINKVKITSGDDLTHYSKLKEYSIQKIYNYLHSNSQIIPDQYETLKRALRTPSTVPDLLNITAHGRYIPTKRDVDEMLSNTQQLLEWAFDYYE